MVKMYGTIDIQSNELPCNDIVNAMLRNNNEIIFDISYENNKRGFTDVEWITFALMAIPATESIVNIVHLIKNEISSRVSKYLTESGFVKTTKISIKIKLPFFSYEKNEEIIIESKGED